MNENNNYIFKDLENILLNEKGESVSYTLKEDLNNLIEYGDFYDPNDYEYKLLI